MSEYIEKEAVINFIENGLNNPDKTKSFGHDAIEIMAEVRYMPAADVVEVRHGKWISEIVERCDWRGKKQQYYQPNSCSACHIGLAKKTNFCPNCGAKMDGKEVE